MTSKENCKLSALTLPVKVSLITCGKQYKHDFCDAQPVQVWWRSILDIPKWSLLCFESFLVELVPGITSVVLSSSFTIRHCTAGYTTPSTFSTTSQQDRNPPNPAEAWGQVALCRFSRSAASDSLRKNCNQLDYLFCIFDFPGTVIGVLLSNFKQQNWLPLLESLCGSTSRLTCQWNIPKHTNA